ncbi:TetR/AcrR family transcriptional regulator [Catellatospora sp. KI3]|uniref:TetR/AcrR family transcriptional regulator n=1 Tax=Catellatospora sp. KI3 TaxID=3041620 RepID=UPI002482AC05|nr:TetR/AcrR family transcriptional regulator [Catellatospora sp. KI3]MDI1462574.1 TetR/AcrR family transcriptional regulator [Catellatospora sp. KI3]
MPTDNPSTREMLDRVIAYAAAEGITGRSLREIAAGVGTSHRMLIYHFGSREGMLGAIVALIEQRQRDLLADLPDQLARTAGQPATGPEAAAALMLALWRQVSDPALRPFVRLFFEVVGVAVHGTPGTESFLDGLTRPWLDQAEATARRLGLPLDREALLLGIATSRGLLLELLAGADPAQTDAAYHLFVRMWSHWTTTTHPPAAAAGELPGNRARM